MNGYDTFFCRWKVIPTTGGENWEVRDTQSARVFPMANHSDAVALAEYLEEVNINGFDCSECCELIREL